MRQYSRNFITLKQERGEYSYNGRQALGRCIIESRDSIGKISVYVQDLKPQILYKLYLICSQNGQSVGAPIGAINVDERGKSEAKWEFNADDVAGSGIAIEAFNVAAVIVAKKNDIEAILVGFTNGMVMWRNNFIEPSDNKDERNEKAPEELLTEANQYSAAEDYSPEDNYEHNAVSAINEPPDDNASNPSENDFLTYNAVNLSEMEDAEKTIEEYDSAAYGIKKEKDIAEAFEKEMKKENYIEFGVEKSGDISAKPSENTLEAAHLAFREIINKFNNEMEILQNYKLDDISAVSPEKSVAQESTTADVIDDLYACSVPSTPFPGKYNDITWIHISIKELALLECSAYMDMPFVVAGCRKYGHLLLGRMKRSDENRYILGVPEKYSTRDEDFINKAGFNFINCEGDEISEKCFGYWLLDICK